MKWLSVVGIGEDGFSGLSAIAIAAVEQAEVIVGGTRHLAMLPVEDNREKISWTSPLEPTIDEIVARRGKNVCVLASGNPQYYGIGVILLQRIPIEEMTIIPAPSSFSLACARLGWAQAEVEKISLTNRPPEILPAFLYPGARIIILSAGNYTPTKISDILRKQGYGASKVTVLERMGGPHERILTATAETFNHTDIAALNTIAIECIPQPDTIARSRLAGLPDTAYYHDGQLTKCEARAITLAALAPIPGQLLWDVGAGCGSISIEWMRSHPNCRAVAIEQDARRCHYIADNALTLGVPSLKIVNGYAPEALASLESPDAVFIGGGITTVDTFETCWYALNMGGNLVVNAVTVESEYLILQLHQKYGGTLSRINIQRAEPLGRFLSWRSFAPITQWCVTKTPDSIC